MLLKKDKENKKFSISKTFKWNKEVSDKNGQFYLLAAIVIIAIIIGFASVSNYIKNKSSVTVYNLRDELGIEGAQVLDFGTIKGDEVSVIISDTGTEYK